MNSIKGNEDYLLTHLSNHIATKRTDPAHAQVEADSTSVAAPEEKFDWMETDENCCSKECLFEGPLQDLTDLYS